MEEEQPKKKRIGLGMGIFLLLAAIAFDLLGIVATALAPAVGGIIVNCIGVLVFLPWLYLLDISLISPKQSLQWVLNMGADFGTVGVWFGFTLGTILTIIVVYFEDKTHIPVTMAMHGRNMGKKVLRRIQNPRKAIVAQQRLQRMSTATRAKISGAQRFSFQGSGATRTSFSPTANERPAMKDIKVPEKATVGTNSPTVGEGVVSGSVENETRRAA